MDIRGELDRKIDDWHTDDKEALDSKYSITNSKYSFNHHITVALKGPSTLFYPASKELTNGIMEIKERTRSSSRTLAGFFNREIDQSQIVSPKSTQGAIFMTGDYGAIHSPPIIDGERLFLSIKIYS